MNSKFTYSLGRPMYSSRVFQHMMILQRPPTIQKHNRLFEGYRPQSDFFFFQISNFLVFKLLSSGG